MIYRKVFCKDRLPDKADWLHTDIGYIAYCGIKWGKPRWAENPPHYNEFPVYWFEEIRELTKEEISEKAKKDLEYQHPTVKGKHEIGFRLGFYCGYTNALRDLKEK